MDTNKKYPDFETVRFLFHYNRDTGVLLWKNPKSTRIKRGTPAGCINQDGYLRVRIFYKGKSRMYFAHLLIWIWLYGYVPENEIDHKDQNKLNNRPRNLRESSRICNIRNSGVRKDNISGVKGVCWYKASKKWAAYICLKNRTRHLGFFHYFDEAVCHRLAAEQCLDWDGCEESSSAFEYVRKNVQNL